MATLDICRNCGQPLAGGRCVACGASVVIGCFPGPAEPEPAVPPAETLTWGEHLRTLRRARGISQRALAAAAGVDFTYVSRIERGQFPPPSGRTIERMAEALGVNAIELAHAAGKVLPGYLAKLETENARLRVALIAAREGLHQWAEATEGGDLDAWCGHAQANAALTASWVPGLSAPVAAAS